MHLIHLFIILSFGFLVILAGLFALAKTKKEGLGKIYSITSYLTTLCGSIIVIGGIVGAILMCSCHGESSCHGKKSHCKTEYKKDCKKNSCESTSCDSSKKKCKSACKKEGKKVCKKKIITEGEDGEKDVKVEVEIINE